MSHILVVDDEKNYCTVLARLLEEEGHRVSTADKPFAALELLARESVSLILSDLRMPRMDGMAFLQKVREEVGEVPFIILTAFATVETALEAMKAGAFDYLLKPFNNEDILRTVEKALAYSRLQAENAALRRQLEQGREGEILGTSPAIRKLLIDIGRVAPARTSVLITGESGTGKELVARALHRASPRASGPLVSINCAAFTENLLESELYSATNGEPLPGRPSASSDCLKWPTAAPFFSTRSANFPSPCSPSFFGSSRRGVFAASAGRRRSKATYGCWLLPIATLRRCLAPGHSVRICITVSTS